MNIYDVFTRELTRIRGSKIAKNAGWLLLGQAFGLLFQGITFVMLAHLLGASEYGVFAGAFAFTMVAAQYTSAGTGTVLLRYVSHDQSNFSYYWGNLLVVTTSIGILLIFGLHLIGDRFLNPASARLVLFCAISNCFGFQLTFEIAKIFQAFEQMAISSMLNLGTGFIRLLTVLSMVMLRGHVSAHQWAIASMLVTVCGSAIAITVVIIRFGFAKVKMALLWRHGMEGLGYAFALSTSAVYNDIDKSMLSHYGMNSANGIYSMAYRIVDLASTPISSIRDASLPSLFRRGQSGLVSTSELSFKILKRGLVVGLSAALASYLLAPLLPFFLGAGFAGTVSALRWLALIPLFRSLHQILGSALTAAGFQKYRTAVQAVAAVVNVLLNIWLISRFGWHGAAWASLLTDGLLALLNLSVLNLLLRREVRAEFVVVGDRD